MTRVDWNAYELPTNEIITPFFDNVGYIIEDKEYRKMFESLIDDYSFDILDLVYLDKNDIVGEKLYDIWIECGRDRETFIKKLDNMSKDELGFRNL